MLKQWGEREYATHPAGCCIIGSLRKMHPWTHAGNRRSQNTVTHRAAWTLGTAHWQCCQNWGGWWWDRKYLRALEMRAGTQLALLTSLGHYSSVPLAGALSGCEEAALCSLAQELPVCLQVLERNYIDYCVVFAGLQNVQGDTGKFREF